MLRHAFFLVFLVVIFGGCTSDVPLDFSIYSRNFNQIQDRIVACAASDENTENSRTIVFFKTIENTSNLQVWYSPEYTQDFSQYTEEQPSDFIDLFKGFMGRILSNRESGAIIVSLIEDDKLYYSKPIEILSTVQETILDQTVEVDLENNLMPVFSWENSTIDESSIYFHLITHPLSDQAISGTYSYDNTFQFYKLDNVVFNVTEDENPELIANNLYRITLMHVSDNNWVTRISERTFNTQ